MSFSDFPEPESHPSLVANSTAKENGPTTSVVCTFFVYSHFNRLFPSFKIFHFQNEAQCKNFLVIMSPICMRIKRNFHINGFARSLALSFGQLGNHLLTRSKSQMTPHSSMGSFISSSFQNHISTRTWRFISFCGIENCQTMTELQRIHSQSYVLAVLLHMLTQVVM